MSTVLVNSAIKYADGTIETGRRHCDVIALMAKVGVYTRSDNSIQGFVDNRGQFYDREQARKVAIKSGQLPKHFEGEVYSEDLWPGPDMGLED